MGSDSLYVSLRFIRLEDSCKIQVVTNSAQSCFGPKHGLAQVFENTQNNLLMSRFFLGC